MKSKTLSIIIPVYNEKNTILKILERIGRIDLPVNKEIIIVDDFSTDGTREIIEKIKNYKIIFHEKNKGKGSAIRTGLKYASGEYIIIQDADLEYDPGDYPKLLQPIINNKASVVYGSRFFKIKSKDRWLIPSHYLGNKILSLITSLLYRQKIADMETCYKVFKREILKDIKINSKRFDFEPEFTAKILKKHLQILEIPINYHPRDFKKGKKITCIDGIKALFVLLKYRFFN